MHRTILFLLSAAALVALTGSAAHAQWTFDPCFEMDTTAWNAGPGWETVGDCAIQQVEDIFFDAEGTLYGRNSRVVTLDTAGSGPDEWRSVPMPVPWFNFFGLLPLSTADSLVGQPSGPRRTTDRHATWAESGLGYAVNLHAAPTATFRAGRLFSSDLNRPLNLSDDRGASWRPVAQYPEGYDLQKTSLAFFPAGPGPWGAGYGGRTIAAGFDLGVSLSDDGGDTWRRSTLWRPGYYSAAAVLARPLAEGGGLRAVVVGEVSSTPSSCASVWTSDDGGDSWTERAPMCEPCVGSGCERIRKLLPLARRVTGGAPVSGAALAWPATTWETTEAVALLGEGGVFRTRDGGATWTREDQVPIQRPDRDTPWSAALSPDGRLYVGTIRGGPDGAWVLRTAEGLVVSRDESPSPAAPSLAVSVRPNPARLGGAGSSGAVTVSVAVGAPSSSVRVAVFDAVGREVARLHDGASPAGGLSLALDTSRLAPGVYTVRVTAGTSLATARLTVTR